ncbi:MAG: peptidoglycan-binding protein [Myxococcaceae bacterium]|nr:peptidoglycan-binding protein [Myxococcaceae bacterium]
MLVRRVLPNEAKSVKADVALLQKAAQSKNLLDLGDSGKAVQALQRHLRATGLYLGPVSGTFDAATADALKQFQTTKKLTATGALDLATYKALKGINKFVQNGFEGKGNHATVGQRGSDILTVEKRLAKLGFLDAKKVDGIYDQATVDAVLRYRKADHEVPDGFKTIGSTFSKELARASKGYDHGIYRKRDVTDTKGLKRHQQLDAVVKKAVAQAGEGGLAKGAKGRAVKWLQTHLEAAGFELGAQNGTFGSRTEAAVRAFQAHAKLPVTGKVDAKTWAKLSQSYFGAKSATSPAQKLGERDSAVLRTEKMLKALGYKVKADGYFDAKTESAVKRFQKKHHLKATGAVGTGTLNSLKKAQWHPGTWHPSPGRLPGGDFSHYQSTALFNSVIKKSKWGAIKATEGTSYTDPTFKSRWATMGKLIQQGKLKLRMAYAFLHAGNGVAQAKKLLNVTGIHGKLQPGTRLVLDWEAGALSSPKTLKDAANYLHKVTGVWPVIYCSESQVARAKAAVPKAFIWCAKWSSNIPKNYPFVQYSDGPGYDHDVFNGGIKALERFAGWRA